MLEANIIYFSCNSYLYSYIYAYRTYENILAILWDDIWGCNWLFYFYLFIFPVIVMQIFSDLITYVWLSVFC